MRKTLFHLFAATLSITAAVSCAKEAVQPLQEDCRLVKVTLTVKSESSKATLNENKPAWEIGDQIAVWDGSAVRIFTNLGGDSFSGEVQEGTTDVKVAFPATSEWKGNRFNSDIPAEQTIDDGDTVDSKVLAMIGNGAINSPIRLHNNCAILKFYVEEGTSQIIIHTGDKHKDIASSSQSLTVNLPGTAGTFYATVKTESYEGIHVFTYDGSDWSSKDSDNEFTLAPNGGKNLGTITGGAACTLISTGDELKTFLESASTNAYVLNDLDLTGVTLASAASFDSGKIFDAQGYEFSNWTSNAAALFTQNSGTIKNIHLTPDCDLTATTGDFGFIVSTNTTTGIVSGCSNAASITRTMDDTSDQYVFGTIVGRNNGFMKNCFNSGNLSFTFKNGFNANQYIGGVAGIVGSPTDDVRMYHCENSGNITIDCTSGTQKNTFIGGVFGASAVNGGTSGTPTDYTKYYGEIKECYNSGDITYTSCSGSGGYHKVGGISGYGECSYTECVNEGNISFDSNNTVPASGPSTGGISGIMAGPSTAKDCANHGEISQSGMFANASSKYAQGLALNTSASIGGCFGTVGDRAVLVDNCDNDGQITTNTIMSVSAGSAAQQGGIVGFCLCPIKNCDNSASSLNFNSSCAAMYMGGIVGQSSSTDSESIYNCHSSAVFNPSVDLHNYTKDATLYAYVGGIAGMAKGTIDGCTLEGPITTAFVNAGNQNGTKVNEFRFGGIVADTDSDVKNCTVENSATIQIHHDYKLYAGGVVGFQRGAKEVSGCTNNADITIDNSYGGHAAPKQTWFGGVLGWTNVAGFTLSNCTNTGNISTSGGDTPSAFNYYGGVFGGYSAGGNTTTISGCTNSGNISSTCGSKMRIGGVAAAMNAAITNLVNTGNISMTGGAAGSRAGGLAGYCASSISKGQSSGTVYANGNGSNSAAGGLAGDILGVTLTDIELDAQVSGDAILGIVAGCFSAASKTLTLGSAGHPFSLSKSSSLNGTLVSDTPTDDELLNPAINPGTITRTSFLVE